MEKISKATIYFDGACLPFNPNGVATYGFVIKNSGSTVFSDKGVASERGTNNIAEYTALIKALEKALELGYKEVEVFGDSQLVVRQINGEYAVKSETIYPLYLKASGLLENFEKWKIQWVRRDKNKEADALSRQAFIEHIESRNLQKAEKIHPSCVERVGDSEFRVGTYVVKTNPPFCSCYYFQYFNALPLLKRDNITVRCKHILLVDKIDTDKPKKQ